MRNLTESIRTQAGSPRLDATVFHGSDSLFSEFDFVESNRIKKEHSPGLWFGADEGYCRTHGRYIYECQVRSDKIRWSDDGDLIPAAAATEIGVTCQVLIYPSQSSVNDAIITCNDLSAIEMVRVYDRELECYFEASEIDELIAEMNGVCSPAQSVTPNMQRMP